MPDVKAIYNQGVRGYQSALVEAEAQFRQAQLDDDLATATTAAMQINSLRLAMQSWDNMAAEVSRQQRPVRQANKFGLSADEVEIARGIGGTARGLTDEIRERLYAEKKQLYRQKLADGSYSSGQGMQREKF